MTHTRTAARKRSPHFDRAVRPLLGDLRRLAVRLTGNRADADDLVQETMTRIQPRLDEIAALDRPWPWLSRVLYRLFVDEWRRQRRQPETDHGVEVDDQSDHRDLPDAALERSLTHTRLQDALNQLPHQQREAVILYDVEGYTLNEIAEMTDAAVGTLKSRLHRARAALRLILAES
jgi:RNA polymerase sigma-70 factor (ECF subfamily)